MTNGDKIRAMTDEELAWMFTDLMHRQRMDTLSHVQRLGLVVNVVEMPLLSQAAHLKWLREEAGEG